MFGQRIRTTHTGSLPRPVELVALWRSILESGSDDHTPELELAIEAAIEATITKQREARIDLINDGEMGKVSYVTYIKERLTGFGGESRKPPLPELRDFPEYIQRLDPSFDFSTSPACDSPVTLQDPEAVHREHQQIPEISRR